MVTSKTGENEKKISLIWAQNLKTYVQYKTYKIRKHIENYCTDVCFDQEVIVKIWTRVLLTITKNKYTIAIQTDVFSE